MIRSFADKRTAALFESVRVPDLPHVLQPEMQRKLGLIDAACAVDELRIPPGNRLELLRGNRRGYYSIRVNSQWRICFRWDGTDAHDVAIADYH